MLRGWRGLDWLLIGLLGVGDDLVLLVPLILQLLGLYDALLFALNLSDPTHLFFELLLLFLAEHFLVKPELLLFSGLGQRFCHTLECTFALLTLMHAVAFTLSSLAFSHVILDDCLSLRRPPIRTYRLVRVVQDCGQLTLDRQPQLRRLVG